jgi:hypothetical protein
MNSILRIDYWLPAFFSLCTAQTYSSYTYIQYLESLFLARQAFVFLLHIVECLVVCCSSFLDSNPDII